MKKLLLHIRNWLLTSLIAIAVMGSVMLLMIISDEEATLNEITLSDIRYGIVLALVTSAFFFYPVFYNLLRATTGDEPIRDEDEKLRRTKKIKTFLKTALKYGLIIFIGVLLTNIITDGELKLLFSFKYGFGGGLITSLFISLITSFSKTDETTTEKPKTKATGHPFKLNWIVATISYSFMFVYTAFIIDDLVHGKYTEYLFNIYLPIALLLGIAFGQWMRIRNNRIKKEDNN